MIDQLKVRLRALFRKTKAELEMDEELRYHIEKKIEQNISFGMTPADARREALTEFGGFEKTREQCRDARGVRIFEEFWLDLRYGLRTLLKTPVFMIVSILTLGLGIGANTTIFSVVNGVLLRPMSFKES